MFSNENSVDNSFPIFHYIVVNIMVVSRVLNIYSKIYFESFYSRSLPSYNFFFFADYVYFEASNNSPYHIRRIEELNKVSQFCMPCRSLVVYWRAIE